MAQKLHDVVALHDAPAGTPGTAGTNANPDIVNAAVEKLGLNGVVKTTVDHNRFTTLSAILSIALLITVKYVEPTVPDPLYPSHNTSVTEEELNDELTQFVSDKQTDIKNIQTELANMQKQVEITQNKIQAENAQLAAAFTTIITAAAPAAGPFAPVVLGITGLLTAGLAADGIRKSSVAGQSSTTANAAAQNTGSSTSTTTDPNQLQSLANTLAQLITTQIKK